MVTENLLQTVHAIPNRVAAYNNDWANPYLPLNTFLSFDAVVKGMLDGFDFTESVGQIL